MIQTIRSLSIATVCCILGGQFSFAEPLRWRFSQGELFRVTFAQQSVTSSAVGKPPVKLTSEMSMEMHWTVDEVSATGDARMKQSIERFKTKIVAAGAEPVEFDSASNDEPKPSARGIAASVSPLLGKSFSVTMNLRGAISDLKLSKELAAAIDEFVVDDQIRSLFSTNGMRRTLQQAFPLLPENAVSKGDTWTTETKLPSPFGPLDLHSTFQLGDDVILNGSNSKTITATGQVKYLQQVDNARAPIVIKKHSTSGEYSFDSMRGRVVSSKTAQEIVSLNRIGRGQLEIQTKSTMAARLEVVEN